MHIFSPEKSCNKFIRAAARLAVQSQHFWEAKTQRPTRDRTFPSSSKKCFLSPCSIESAQDIAGVVGKKEGGGRGGERGKKGIID